MAKVIYDRHRRIARITLNRPAVLNAIDDGLPRELVAAVKRADADDAVHVIVLAGSGRAFGAGYDLMHYAQKDGANRYTQELRWDPMKASSPSRQTDSPSTNVIPGLVPGIHQAARSRPRDLAHATKPREEFVDLWIPGIKPGMTAATVDAGSQGR